MLCCSKEGSSNFAEDGMFLWQGVPQILLLLWVKTPCKISNSLITPSGRKVTQGESKREEREFSAHADGGPCSRVCARTSLGPIPKIVVHLSCFTGWTNFARTNLPKIVANLSCSAGRTYFALNKALNSGHLILWQRTTAARTNFRILLLPFRAEKRQGYLERCHNYWLFYCIGGWIELHCFIL